MKWPAAWRKGDKEATTELINDTLNEMASRRESQHYEEHSAQGLLLKILEAEGYEGARRLQMPARRAVHFVNIAGQHLQDEGYNAYNVGISTPHSGIFTVAGKQLGKEPMMHKIVMEDLQVNERLGRVNVFLQFSRDGQEVPSMPPEENRPFREHP